MSNVTTGNKLVNEILEIADDLDRQSQGWYKASLFETVEHLEPVASSLRRKSEDLKKASDYLRQYAKLVLNSTY